MLCRLLLLLLLPALAPAQALPDSPFLDSLLHTAPALAPVLARPDVYHYQIIYTRIDRDAQNVPHFTQYTYHVNPRQYFNPASLVKLPTALLALEKLHTLPASVSRSTIMGTGANYRCQTPVPFAAPADTTRWATVGNYIKRMLLVSDNVAYNRLYEFVGQHTLNARLQQLGYPSSRIVRRFAPCDTAANCHTNPITFYTPAGDTLYKQSAQVNPRTPAPPLGSIRVGRAYQAGGRLIHRPYDFTTANNLPLPDITALLQTALFPESIPTTQRPALSPPDYAFLRQYLHLTPHASHVSAYQSANYFDAYKKYLYYGRRPEAAAQPTLRIFNIVGMSHGYLADVAYFADSLHHAEFLLSAVLYVNRNGILNDGQYEYDSIGLPFLAQLGQLFVRYEARRPRRQRPDLELFFLPAP